VLPLIGSPEQQCRIATMTLLFIKIFLRTSYLKEQLILKTQLYYYTNAALKTLSVLSGGRVMCDYAFN